MVVKSTAFSVPPKCKSYNISYRINILIGLTLINMFIKTKQISYSTLAQTQRWGSSPGIEEAFQIWEALGREEQLVALMNSMHKTGVGFRDVEESVQCLEDIKWSSKVSKGGGGTKYIAGRYCPQKHLGGQKAIEGKIEECHIPLEGIIEKSEGNLRKTL